MDDNKIALRILKSVGAGGPRKREILEHMATEHGSKHPTATVAGMIEDGTLIKYGDRRGARWGAPGWKL